MLGLTKIPYCNICTTINTEKTRRLLIILSAGCMWPARPRLDHAAIDDAVAYEKNTTVNTTLFCLSIVFQQI